MKGLAEMLKKLILTLVIGNGIFINYALFKSEEIGKTEKSVDLCTESNESYLLSMYEQKHFNESKVNRCTFI
jgi:hypothetical protein